MPGQSGMDLLKLLDAKKRPHVIILTGFATFEYAREALKYGVSDYLLKPIKPETLTDSVISLKETLDRENNRTKALLQLEWTSAVIEQETQRNFSEAFIQAMSRPVGKNCWKHTAYAPHPGTLS